MSDRKAYPSDLTDAEWEVLEPLIPAISPDAVRVEHSRREIESADPLRLTERLSVEIAAA
jgi:putative transposase